MVGRRRESRRPWFRHKIGTVKDGLLTDNPVSTTGGHGEGGWDKGLYRSVPVLRLRTQNLRSFASRKCYVSNDRVVESVSRILLTPFLMSRYVHP